MKITVDNQPPQTLKKPYAILFKPNNYLYVVELISHEAALVYELIKTPSETRAHDLYFKIVKYIDEDKDIHISKAGDLID